MATRLGDIAVGNIVKLNVGGVAKEFLIVHQGLPSSLYDASCNGTWLLTKDIYESRQWHSSNVNDYENSTIHSYLNSTFLNLFDANIREQIKTVKIPYVNDTANLAVAFGANGLSAQIFLLSGYEVGWTQSNYRYFPIDGACLSYFSGAAVTDSKRIGYLNGTSTYWWLRSSFYNFLAFDLTSAALYVDTSGGYNNGNCSVSYGIRPAMILPTTLFVAEDGDVTTEAPMEKGLFTSINGVQRKLTECPIIIDGISREMKTMFGAVDGVQREIFSGIRYTWEKYLMRERFVASTETTTLRLGSGASITKYASAYLDGGSTETTAGTIVAGDYFLYRGTYYCAASNFNTKMIKVYTCSVNTEKQLVGTVQSKDLSDYPTNGLHTDGYWYIKI